MYITYCDKFVQIELAQGSRLLKKVLEYANKHFSKRYHLSSSLLILDDGERFKKDYLINWAYHATMQSVASLESAHKADTNKANPNDEKKSKTPKKSTKQSKSKKSAKSSANMASHKQAKADLEDVQKCDETPKYEDSKAKSKQADLENLEKVESSAKSAVDSTIDSATKTPANASHTDDTELAQILSYSHLPIRIKITNPNSLLKRVKVQIHLSNLGQILVRLPENNRVARRYIHAIFGRNIIYEVDNEFCISAVGYTESMWEGVMGLISSRIIHNVALDFEFNTSSKDDDSSGFGGEGFDSFLTREEYLLRKCYSELNADYRDDFAEVKKQYLKLAKKFHPDNAQGKDSGTIQVFEERFKRISQAYNTIKAATCAASMPSHSSAHTDKTTA